MTQSVRSLLAACVAVYALCVAVDAQSIRSQITAEDLKAADLAGKAKLEFCGPSGFRGEVDRVKRRQDLLDATGNENVILNVLKKSKSTNEMLDNVKTEITPNWIVARSWPIALAIIALIIWWFCCWTALPFRRCCQCCRCCSKSRRTFLITKFFGILLMLGLVIGVIVAAVLAGKGFSSARDGFDNMACTGGGLLDSTLSGNPVTPGPYFIGILPMLRQFSDLDDSLADGSPMLRDVGTLLDSTKTISAAVTVATQTLQVLSNMLKEPANNVPGNNLHHTCAICEPLASQALQPAIDALDGGVGKALAQARQEVDKQLSPSARSGLQGTLRSAVQPLVQLKDVLRQVFSFLLDTEKFKQVSKMLAGESSPVYGGILGLVICAFVLLFFGLTGQISFIFCERCDKRTKEGGNPYCKYVHRVSCCTWCFSFLYVIIAFILGGILYAVSAPLGGMCLIMDDLNGQLAKDVMPAFGQSVQGDQGSMFINLLDKCFTKEAVSQNNNMLDLVFTRDGSGNQQTVNQKIKVSVKDSVASVFDTLDTKLALPSIATDSNVVSLRSILANTGLDSVILPDPDYRFDQDASFQALLAYSPDTFALMMQTSTACANKTLAADVPTIGGQTISGINTFRTSLKQWGSDPLVPGQPCGGNVVCNAGASLSACNAGNNFLNLKRQVTQATYRCDLFQNPTNPAAYCDPKDMMQSGGVWSNDCLDSNGQLTIKRQDCSFADFVQYIKDFDARINKVVMRLDTDSNAVKDGINRDLRRITNTYLLGPIDAVTSGVTCGFLAQYYRQTVDGLCFQAVYGVKAIGVSYVVCALLISGLIIVAYSLWRRAIDNVNNFVLPTSDAVVSY